MTVSMKLQVKKTTTMLMIVALLAASLLVHSHAKADGSSAIIIDNGDPGYAESGTWDASGLLGYDGTSTRTSFSPGAYATWTPDLTAGTYEVSIYKVVYANSDPNAKIEIAHADGVATQFVNYTAGTSGWVSLGVYDFNDGNQGYVQNSRNGGGAARADAVKFEKVTNPTTAMLTNPVNSASAAVDEDIVIAFSGEMDAGTLNLTNIALRETASGTVVDAVYSIGGDGKSFTIHPEESLANDTSYTLSIGPNVRDMNGRAVVGTKQWTFTTVHGNIQIIDNGDPGYAESGTWSASGLPGYSGTGTRVSFTPGAYAEWTPSLTAGMYEVSVYKIVYPGSDPNAAIEIRHANVTDTVYLDYTAGASGWVSLGIFPFDDGSQGYVKNIRNGGGAARADAVRFEKVDNPTTAALTAPDRLSNVPVDTGIVLAFSAAMDAETVNDASIELRDNATDTPIDAAYTLSGDRKTLTIQPLNDLNYNSLYTVSIHSNALDTNGERVYGIAEWTFLTGIVPPDPLLRQDKTLVGAIRWDAWVGDLNSAGLEVEQTLGPEKYHFRLPFFAQILGTNTVQIRGTTQSIMDQEIAYAKAGGIDYWAFLWYPPGSGLDTSRNLYLSSSHKDDVKWSVILSSAFNINTDLPWLIEQFATSNYQKVQGNRPLVYFIDGDAGFSLKQIGEIRAKTMEAGLATPYIVSMGFSADVANVADQIGADAISCYSYPGTAIVNGIPYSQLAAMEEEQWDSYKETGKQVVPTVTTGKDKRPRYDNPVSWEPNYAPFENMWAAQGTPEEIAGHLADAVDWNNAYPDATPANTALIYAWNENDEGGWIVPTLFEIRDSGRPLRLDAIRNVLDTTAPTTTDDAPAGWVDQDVTVNFTATDDLSGVAATYYTVDGGPVQTGTSAVLTADGEHAITYWSVDQAGNTETEHSVTVKIDKTV